MKCPQCDQQCSNAEGVLRHQQVVHHNIGPRLKGGKRAYKERPVQVTLRPLWEEVHQQERSPQTP